MIGALAGLAGSVISGIMGSNAANKNIKMQEKFAKQGIQWKVADAKAAGLHPLAALGANTMSFSPVSVGVPDFGPALADMGQNIDRARMATAGPSVRGVSKVVQDLTLERAGLENDKLRSEIRTINAQIGPAMPEMIPEKIVDPSRTKGLNFGTGLKTNPKFSDAQTYEDRYGELGGSALGLTNIPADLYQAAVDYMRKHPDLWRAGGAKSLRPEGR